MILHNFVNEKEFFSRVIIYVSAEFLVLWLEKCPVAYLAKKGSLLRNFISIFVPYTSRTKLKIGVKILTQTTRARESKKKKKKKKEIKKRRKSKTIPPPQNWAIDTLNINNGFATLFLSSS